MCFPLLNTETYWDSVDGSYSRMSKISKSKSFYTICFYSVIEEELCLDLGHGPLAENPVQMSCSPICLFVGMQLLKSTHLWSHIPRLWFPIWYKSDNLGNVWDITGCRCGQVQPWWMWEVSLCVCFANVDLMILSENPPAGCWSAG